MIYLIRSLEIIYLPLFMFCSGISINVEKRKELITYEKDPFQKLLKEKYSVQ